MANTKTYTVVKDGETLKELKTLAAAKKLADAEGAEVFCEGECVYQPTFAPAVEEEPVETQEPEDAPKAPDTYTLLRKMNVRKAPSLKADKLKVLDTGSIVEVDVVEDDWLHLTDGTFILYEDGKNARKVRD